MQKNGYIHCLDSSTSAFMIASYKHFGWLGSELFDFMYHALCNLFSRALSKTVLGHNSTHRQGSWQHDDPRGVKKCVQTLSFLFDIHVSSQLNLKLGRKQVNKIVESILIKIR